jgi:hypothetical protein
MQDEDSLLPLFEVENGLPAKIEAISTCIKVGYLLYSSTYICNSVVLPRNSFVISKNTEVVTSLAHPNDWLSSGSPVICSPH